MHRRLCVEVLKDEVEGGRTADVLCIYFVFRRKCKGILLGRTLRLMKIESMFIAVVRYKAAFTVTMQSLLSYLLSFEEHYGVHLFDVHKRNVVDIITFSTVLPINDREIYALYNSV